MAPNLKENEMDAENEILDSEILDGRILASPDPGEEVCITGLSGVYPNSRNVHEFRDNLMNKVDMVDDDERRWTPFHHEIPHRSGKIYDIEKFDLGFFGIQHKQAISMDPMQRIFLEKAIEAIFDAGYHPSELEGTRTAVFVGTCFAESEKRWFFDHLEHQTHAITGCMRCMIAHRLSHFLKLRGMSYTADTACSSSLTTVENAYRAIRRGQCDMAIVGGTNLLLHPFITLQFARLGVLSLDGCCRCFDESASGYARSETISCILLQKAKDSRRIYASIVHAKTNCDGYKEQGITFPSCETQSQLMRDFYKECNVDPRSVSYVEAHGTGTKVGDPEECAAIDAVFCEGRKKPLLVGSVKSSIGHTEPSSGLCSITKCIIGMEEGIIPPNMYYTKPREGITALKEGRMKVVSERTPFLDENGLMGINSFGFGGANSHVLLKWNPKLKVDGGQPKDDLPRLLCVSGRTPESITSLTNDVNSRKLDAEHIQLLHEVFKKDINPHPYRGYTITSKEGEIKSSVRIFDEIKPPHLVLAFGSFGDFWQPLAKSLSAFPVFAATIQRVNDVLRLAKTGLNINEMIDNPNSRVDPIMQNVMGNVILHIGIVEILKDLEMAPDHIMGYALGEIACAYYDGCLSLEQTVLTAFEIAVQLKNVNEPSSTYIVELEETQVMKLLPPGIEIVYKNRGGNLVVSGPQQITQKFAESLQKIGVVVKQIDSASVTWHTKKNSGIESALVPKLKTIISTPKNRSEKWLSASTEKVASPVYFVRALHSQIIHEELSDNFNSNPVIFEIGIGVFAEILKNAVVRPVKVVKFGIDLKEGVALLEALGCLYEYGFNPQIQKLYPKIEYPVGRGTPMIAPNIKWEHSKDWFVMRYSEEEACTSGERVLRVTLKEEEFQYLSGHVVDGRNLFPATGYLHATWGTLAAAQSTIESRLTVVFENCRFKRATTVHDELTDFIILIQKNSGNFEVSEGGVEVVSGRVYSITDDSAEFFDISQPFEDNKSEEIQMDNRDIYKELSLRGYNYTGAFKAIKSCNQDASVAWIKWEGNWVSFLDNLLQIKILQFDTRLLYVPTSIKRMIIDPNKHREYVESFGEENPVLPIYVSKDADIITCGGVQIKGLMASSIPRRKQLGEPVLEKYDFVPNELLFVPLEQSIRVNMQIGLENLPSIKIKVVELLDEATRSDSTPLSPIVSQVFGDQPLIQTSITVLSSEKLELENVTVENKKLVAEDDCYLVIGSKMLQRSQILESAFGALKKNGFILSREGPEFEVSKLPEHNRAALDILTVHDLGDEKFVFFRKAINTKEVKLVNVSEKDEEFSWLRSIQNHLKSDSQVIIYSQNEDSTGILGLFNCIRREPGGMNVRCFIIFDADAPEFDLKHPFYQSQMKKNMSVNIYKNGKWGTYRHLLLNQVDEVETEHCFVNPLIRGDLSSLRWIEGSLTSKTVLPPEQKLVQIYCASLNFRDVMTALGRISPDVITKDRTKQECVQGFEFSGIDPDGRRVMGMTTQGALSTLIAADSYLLWEIPKHWTLEQGATVPTVYGTVLYALILCGKMKKGETILIHSGTGGVGQAAINVALAYGCTVYTTVGTQEKRDFIKKLFPQLTDRHIGNSRDLSFENFVKKETKGRGVDLVLNSLAGEMLLASVRCLARGGRFLEIGKFDMANDTSLGLSLFSKGCSFHGIMLDELFYRIPSTKAYIGKLILEGIEKGYVKPLMTNVFNYDEIEKAFRFMASGKHMGKVMIRVKKEEPLSKTIAPTTIYKAVPRINCNEDKSYIITGGLGGFGLELADWLVLRGARKLILTSRSGVKTGYQSYRIGIWKSYGTLVKISTADITTKEGCKQLIREAQELGPIESIFNLAVVLKDSLLENQTSESFRVSLGPKAMATKYLDEITRIDCPDLRDFVVFSSVSCGRGNTGQTNYGMANSIMERICEKRRRDGYPALAIQWGAIGDVGLVAEMMVNHTPLEIGGTLQQRITSCLQVMDTFLRQKEAAVVSSMVVAMKKSGSGGADNIVDAVANILGIKKHSVSLHATLAELGMDSMTAVEIKQTLEREFEVTLTAQDIRTMTLSKLQELQQSKESETVQEKVPTGIQLILRYLGDESIAKLPVIQLPSLVEENSDAPLIFIFSGIEGVATTLKPLAANLKAKVVGIQFTFENPTMTYKDLTQGALTHIENSLEPNAPLNIIAYSWGSIIALEVMAIMEKRGHKGNLICLDGSPGWVLEMCKQEFKTDSDADMETKVLYQMMTMYLPSEIAFQNLEKIYACKNFEERLDVFQNIVSKSSTHSQEYQRKAAIAYITRLKELNTYSPRYTKVTSPVRLYKASTPSAPNLAEDYLLTEYCANLLEVKSFDGNHISIINNMELAENVNESLGLMAPLTSKIQKESIQVQNGGEAIRVNGSC